jgi:hypothetical protein
MRIGITCFNIRDHGVAKNWEKKYVALGDVRKRLVVQLQARREKSGG